MQKRDDADRRMTSRKPGRWRDHRWLSQQSRELQEEAQLRPGGMSGLPLALSPPTVDSRFTLLEEAAQTTTTKQARTRGRSTAATPSTTAVATTTIPSQGESCRHTFEESRSHHFQPSATAPTTVTLRLDKRRSATKRRLVPMQRRWRVRQWYSPQSEGRAQ